MVQLRGTGLTYLQRHSPGTAFRQPGNPAALSYVRSRGCALVAGTPLGPEEGWPSLLEAFGRHCRAGGLDVAFCGVPEHALALFPLERYRSLTIGDEALVNLNGLDLKGRQWRECRAALNRAARRGITLEWVEPAGRAALQQELRAVTDDWLDQRGFPEMQFLLGAHSTIADPRVLLAVNRWHDGSIRAFATWVPSPDGRSCVLDLMRRRNDAMPGGMDFLLARSMLDLRERGYVMASLGGSPLSNVNGRDGGLPRLLLDLAFHYLPVPYTPRKLFWYKTKFNPHWAPLYLLYSSQAVLPKLTLSLLAACFPTLGPTYWLRAAIAQMINLF